MDQFRSAASAVAIASAAVCLTENLVGGTRLHRQMKLMLDAVLAIVMIVPFANGAASFELPEIGEHSLPDSSYALEIYNRQLTHTAADNVGSVLLSQISAAGIVCTDIVIDVNISEDGSIFISRVTVSSDDFAAAEEVIRNSLGSEVEVVNGSP